MDWKKLSNDNLPPTDGEAMFVGINTAGFFGCFNALSSFDNGKTWNASYETAEETIETMGDVEYWCELQPPNALANVPASTGD